MTGLGDLYYFPSIRTCTTLLSWNLQEIPMGYEVVGIETARVQHTRPSHSTVSLIRVYMYTCTHSLRVDDDDVHSMIAFAHTCDYCFRVQGANNVYQTVLPAKVMHNCTRVHAYTHNAYT